jgi:putative CocE/NonD family hydrolase
MLAKFARLKVVLALSTCPVIGLAAQTGPEPTPTRRDVPIPMRDGVNLGGDLYLPEGQGPFPVLLAITPYGKIGMAKYAGATITRGVSNGYAVLLVDTRGLRASAGKWEPYVHEGRDGFDVQEWVGQQNWCNGNIGMFGGSYVAYTQVAPAPYRSKYLKAIVPEAAQSDNYGSVWVSDGILHLAFAPRWAASQQAVAEKRELPPIDWVKVAWTLPLSAIPTMLPIKSPFLTDVIRNEAYGDFWRAMSLRHRYREMDVPSLAVVGWYDDLSDETQRNFIGMRRESRSERARRGQHLLIGPWAHGVPRFPDGDWIFGDVNFGVVPKTSLDTIQFRWFDHHLKGIDNGVDKDPPVRIFVMGANLWRDEQEWPLARAVPTTFYFHSQGFANTRFGNGTLTTAPPETESPDRFRYDPRNPVPTHGGHGCCDYGFSSIGPFDQRPTEQRPDVLVYTSAPLEEDVEVTGFGEAHLVFSTDVVDTDFFVTLSDVYPDGRSILITDGQVRTRFRRSTDRPQLLTPNRTDSVTVGLWATSNLFKKGHQIRVRLTSSNFPRFARNLNSGKPVAEQTEREIRIATQTVFHSKGRLSRIVLPIVPKQP